MKIPEKVLKDLLRSARTIENDGEINFEKKLSDYMDEQIPMHRTLKEIDERLNHIEEKLSGIRIKEVDEKPDIDIKDLKMGQNVVFKYDENTRKRGIISDFYPEFSSVEITVYDEFRDCLNTIIISTDKIVKNSNKEVNQSYIDVINFLKDRVYFSDIL